MGFGRWNSELQEDETANDSDKTFTVDSDEEWRVKSIYVELVTTATTGDRQLVVEYQDAAADVIAEVRAGAVQAPSLTRKYLFAVGAIDLTSFRDTDFLMTPLPEIMMTEGFKIRIYDIKAKDAAADDMEVHMMVERIPSKR
ncbi:MAG: hypothetical protein ACE5H0_09150 [Bacteroidota bacterium]